MTIDPREPDADFSELSKLFEESASALDPLTHGRLRAVAREIPERRGLSFRLPRWSFAAGLCALGAAAILLASFARAPSEAPSAARSPAPRASQAEPLRVASAEFATVVEEVDELAGSFDFDDASAPDVLDDLALDPGDLADSEVDAWISAANTTLGG
jgi:hypothetical protein